MDQAVETFTARNIKSHSTTNAISARRKRLHIVYTSAVFLEHDIKL